MTPDLWLMACGLSAAAGLILGYVLGRTDDLQDRGRQ